MADNKYLTKMALAVGGLVGLAYLAKKFVFSESKHDEGLPQQAPLSLQDTKQLMQQIKYQMLVVCINYAQKMTKDMFGLIPPHQREATLEKMKASMMKIYESKQNVILEKHMVTKEDYGSSLLCYESDPFLYKNKNEIYIMMERAINGQGPILDAPEEALNVNTLDSMIKIYQEVCLMISTAVWRKMFQCSQKDPNFDTSNDEHFKKAIREINIYGMRIQYLESKGYKKEWGCPNQIFLKATEAHNLKNQDFKFSIRTIEKAYNKIIDIVSNNPLTLKESDIKMMLENQIAIIKQEQGPKKESELVPDPKDLAGQAQYFLKKGMQAEKELDKSKSQIHKQKGSEKESTQNNRE